MKALVTGAEGFVGAHLVPKLTALGYEVTASVLDTGVDRSEGSGAAVKTLALNVLDPDAARRVVAAARPDVVYHLAGFSSGAKARLQPREALRVNAEGTFSVVNAVADERPDARVIVTGSADVYGDPGADPVGEDASVRPVSPYGISKAAQELVALGVGRARRLDVRVARMFPLVGSGQAEAFVVPSFCLQAAAIAAGDSEPTIHVGNLDVERDFLEVADGADALAALGCLEDANHRLYNVCSGAGTTIRQILQWVLEVAGVEPEIHVDPRRVRPSDPPRIVGHPGRLRHDTEWESAGDVREGVRGVYSWVQRSRDVH